jgi:hypothetical protein
VGRFVGGRADDIEHLQHLHVLRVTPGLSGQLAQLVDLPLEGGDGHGVDEDRFGAAGR